MFYISAFCVQKRSYYALIFNIRFVIIIDRLIFLGDKMSDFKTYEYIWLDGYQPEANMRSKVKATDEDTL